MSIYPAVVKLLDAENHYRAISGDVVLIGRQRIEFSEQTDYEFFGRYPITSIKAIDVSDYEGAELIVDLNLPLPTRMTGIADFIFDGPCLDNMFDPAQAIRSLSRMLRPNGRLVMMEHSTAMHSAYTMMSPEWFFNFFAMNGYDDCQIKLFDFPEGINGTWREHCWEAFEGDKPARTTVSDARPDIGHYLTVVLAERGTKS